MSSGELREFAVTDKVGYVERNSEKRVVGDDAKE